MTAKRVAPVADLFGGLSAFAKGESLADKITLSEYVPPKPKAVDKKKTEEPPVEEKLLVPISESQRKVMFPSGATPLSVLKEMKAKKATPIEKLVERCKTEELTPVFWKSIEKELLHHNIDFEEFVKLTKDI